MKLSQGKAIGIGMLGVGALLFLLQSKEVQAQELSPSEGLTPSEAPYYTTSFIESLSSVIQPSPTPAPTASTITPSQPIRVQPSPPSEPSEVSQLLSNPIVKKGITTGFSTAIGAIEGQDVSALATNAVNSLLATSPALFFSLAAFAGHPPPGYAQMGAGIGATVVSLDLILGLGLGLGPFGVLIGVIGAVIGGLIGGQDPKGQHTAERIYDMAFTEKRQKLIDFLALYNITTDGVITDPYILGTPGYAVSVGTKYLIPGVGWRFAPPDNVVKDINSIPWFHLYSAQMVKNIVWAVDYYSEANLPPEYFVSKAMQDMWGMNLMTLDEYNQKMVDLNQQLQSEQYLSSLTY